MGLRTQSNTQTRDRTKYGQIAIWRGPKRVSVGDDNANNNTKSKTVMRTMVIRYHKKVKVEEDGVVQGTPLT